MKSKWVNLKFLLYIGSCTNLGGRAACSTVRRWAETPGLQVGSRTRRDEIQNTIFGAILSHDLCESETVLSIPDVDSFDGSRPPPTFSRNYAVEVVLRSPASSE